MTWPAESVWATDPSMTGNKCQSESSAIGVNASNCEDSRMPISASIIKSLLPDTASLKSPKLAEAARLACRMPLKAPTPTATMLINIK